MLELLVPPEVRIAEAREGDPEGSAFPGEEAFVERASDGRRREFVMARRCAREALAQLGFAPMALPRGPRGETVWPPGVVGSITHCAGYRAAAVARTGTIVAIGIDAEPAQRLPDGVLRHVATEREARALQLLRQEGDDRCWDRALFSAKESVFKAWYPLMGRRLAFGDAHVDLDPARGSFTVRIVDDAARGAEEADPLLGFGRTSALTGQFSIGDGLVLTAFVLDLATLRRLRSGSARYESRRRPPTVPTT